MFKVQHLGHGGIMANYRCTAACRHCLYACSPTRTDGYITKETAESVCDLLLTAGCNSVHIGGGEPFMDFDGLLELVRTASKAGITVEYIETNAYWAKDKQQVKAQLKELAHAGADTLCISHDQFHAEYVPSDLPLSLAGICREIGFGHFVWQADRSGLQYGGRAISIEVELVKRKSVESILDTKPCNGLLCKYGGHFHVDMYGRYIPPGCTGIAILLEEAVHGIPDGKYPVLEVLLSGGAAELLRYAQGKGFMPDPEGYPSRCAFCIHIRHWLSENATSPELDAEHYRESLMYWRFDSDAVL